MRHIQATHTLPFWRTSSGIILLLTTMLCMGFAVVSLLGWGEYTSLISGTQVAGQTPLVGQAGALLLYMGLYFGAVLLGPPGFAAAFVLWLLERKQDRTPS